MRENEAGTELTGEGLDKSRETGQEHAKFSLGFKRKTRNYIMHFIFLSLVAFDAFTFEGLFICDSH